MWNLLVFELVDTATVLAAAWMIARSLGGGSVSVLQVTLTVDPLSLVEGDDEHGARVIVLPKRSDPLDGVEWPTSSWRPTVVNGAWN